MIEVRGFLGAISAVDAALKAANVELNNAETIRGGLTTIELVGDVAAVHAAVGAGVIVAKKLNCLIAHHVIARIDDQTVGIISKPKDNILSSVTEIQTEKPVGKSAIGELVTSNTESVEKQTKIYQLKESLQNKKVVELRKQAYQMNLETLKKSEIKFANKQALITAIMTEIERSEKDWN
nr:BMC domain-containing protein [Enterococcus mediterraneensis]